MTAHIQDMDGSKVILKRMTRKAEVASEFHPSW